MDLRKANPILPCRAGFGCGGGQQIPEGGVPKLEHQYPRGLSVETSRAMALSLMIYPSGNCKRRV